MPFYQGRHRQAGYPIGGNAGEQFTTIGRAVAFDEFVQGFVVERVEEDLIAIEQTGYRLFADTERCV
ncbi:hypothetical protein D3C78_1787140 [compost metagenome]